MQKPDPTVPLGYVMIVDIVDFSVTARYGRNQQQAMVEQLWSFLREHPTLSPQYEALVNCTGDGALIAFPNKSHTVPMIEVFTLAESIIKHMKDGKPECDMRVGIHCGAFHRIPLPCFPESVMHVIGTGPNECARLVGMADPGDIIVSEFLYNQWRSEDPAISSRFEPQGDDPWVVFVKHGVPQPIRVYVGSRVERRQLKPRKLGFLDLVNSQLNEVVRVIYQEYLESLRKLQRPKGLREEQIGPRVTIFATAKQDNRSTLRPTEFRYDGNDTNSGRIGRTVYSLKDQGEGVLGRCMVLNRPVSILGLRDYKRDPEQYIRRLEEISLPRDKVINLGHKARSFLAVPFGLDKYSPDGAICFDTKHPLTGCDLETLERVGEKIAAKHNRAVASLWRLRAS